MNGKNQRWKAPSLRRTGCLAALVCAVMSPGTFAQSDTNAYGPSARWLLVVDTAQSMESRAEAIQQIGAGLILSGVNGQMRRGDTVGVWTFNEKLDTGQFPLQEWTPERSLNIARRLVEFLRAQTYNKESRLDTVLTDMYRVIKDSDFITVILITGGTSQIQGTPFDKRINATFNSWQKEQANSRLPFITFLRASHGKITDCRVNIPPFPLDLPPPSPDLVAARTPPPKPAPEPPPTAPPLIISGKKPAPTQPPEAEMVVAARPLSNAVPAAEPAAPVPPAGPEITENEKVPANVTAGGQGDSATPSSQPPPVVADASAPAQPRTVVPVQQATVVPPEPLWQRRDVRIGAGIGALLLLMLLLRLRRRSRTEPRISLITRSLDRDRK